MFARARRGGTCTARRVYTALLGYECLSEHKDICGRHNFRACICLTSRQGTASAARQKGRTFLG